MSQRPSAPPRSSTKRAVAASLLVMLAVVTSAAVASADEAEDVYAKASEAEVQMLFAQALDGYRKALSLKPSAAFAVRARIRAEDLSAHAEGDFGPLTRLESVRRNSAKVIDPTELASLATDAASFPPGQVRTEARLLVAEAFARRLSLPAGAIAPARALLEDEQADAPARLQALTLLTQAYTATGQGAKAREVASKYRALSPAVAQQFVTVDQRISLKQITGAVVALMLLVDLVALAFLARAKRLPGALAHLVKAPTTWLVTAALVAGGALLVDVYDATVSAKPFWMLGLGVLLCDRSAALWREAFSMSKRGRLITATAGLACLAATSLLALLLSDPAFIESFGL